MKEWRYWAILTLLCIVAFCAGNLVAGFFR